MDRLLVALQKEFVDVKTTISRFIDNEEIYLKFLYRFPDETQFYQLKQRLIEHKYDDKTLAIAHTFKGLTANLGMNKLFHMSAKIMNDIRNKNYDNIENDFLEIESNYEKICTLIQKYKPVNVEVN